MGVHLLLKILALLQEPVLEKDGGAEVVVWSVVVGEIPVHHRSRQQLALENVDFVQEDNHRRVEKQLVVRDFVEKQQAIL